MSAARRRCTYCRHDVAIKIQFPASGSRYMQISVLRGSICVRGDGGLFLGKCLTSDKIGTESDIEASLDKTKIRQ